MLDLTEELSEMLDRAAAMVLRSNHVVALAGAGLSVESGIPPFRGPGGLWTKHGEPTNLSYKEFLRDPKEWWERRFRNEDQPGDPVYELKTAVDRAQPNPGHHALVEMEQSGFLQCVVTQNVDNLHREAGSQLLLEIHGNRTWLRCVGCGTRQPRHGYHFDSLPPICTECGGFIKMDTVMVRGAHTRGRAPGLPGPSRVLRLHAAGRDIGHGKPGGTPAFGCQGDGCLSDRG